MKKDFSAAVKAALLPTLDTEGLSEVPIEGFPSIILTSFTGGGQTHFAVFEKATGLHTQFIGETPEIRRWCETKNATRNIHEANNSQGQ